MLHSSRALSVVLIIYLLIIVVLTWGVEINVPKENIKNPMQIVSEPKVSGVSQSFLISPLNSDVIINVRTNQFPIYNYNGYLNISGKIEDVAQSSYAKENPGYFLVNNIKYSMFYPEIKTIDYSGRDALSYWSNFRGSLITIRKSLETNISLSLPEPQAGLLSGILLGTRSDLSDDTKEMLAKVGIIHIIALSGYNITIVAEAMRLVFRRHSAKLAFWGSLIGVWLFVFATGFSASVVRAAIMGSLLLLAQKFGRKSSALVSILLASTIMVAINPYILLYDIGFQLSFAAVCGILFFAPRIDKYFKIFGKTFGPILAATISAQIFTLPIISYYFARISSVSLIVNLLVVPIIPIVMLMGFIGAVISYVSLWLGGLILAINWYLLNYIFSISEFFANTSFAEVIYEMPLMNLVIIYVLLIEITLILKKKDKNAKKVI